MRTLIAGFALALAGFTATAHAQADAYPVRPVRLVVTYAAGGISDVIGRTVAAALSRQLGQQVIVENRPGASGMIGHELVAKAPPDGYTLVLNSGGPMAINIQMVEKPRYDPVKDFTPIGLVTFNDSILIVNNDFPAKNFAEFVDVVKRNPGKYSFGSAGTGLPTHLGGELLKQAVGLDIQHVPYKGDAPALLDVIGGNVPMMVAAFGSVAAAIRAGQVRPIAVLSRERIPTAATVPTVAEMGYPGFNAMTWGGIAGPAGLPAPVVARLGAALKGAMADEDLKAKYAQIGSNLTYSTPDEMTAFLREETAKWGAIIRRLGLRSNE